ncbi:MAG: hypothetical protein HQK51_18410, partial [Oligoflexia bacterium]|nr:hypothetical protein [Oligoflexia bacterium]
SIDIFISKLCETLIFEYPILKHYSFFSEENDYSELKFPALILDPIDGTKELSMGIGECALSLALFNSAKLSDPVNYSLIFNPFTGFQIDSLTIFTPPKSYYRDNLRGLVSISEWERGLFSNHMNRTNFKRMDTNENASITPFGSIAFKLALLSNGACDFIVSLQPKNIRDIAAGTHLADLHGFNFYEGKNLIKSLDKEKYYPPLCWCRKQDVDHISSVYFP